MKKVNNVVSLTDWRNQQEDLDEAMILRLAPELDGLETLYTNDANPDLTFNLKIIAWALKEDGDVVGLVPWLDDIIECPKFDDALNGTWAGYYNPMTQEIFYEAPLHKVTELEMNYEYYCDELTEDYLYTQEIPETLGTHAVISEDNFQTIQLIEVISWRLYNDGCVYGMLPDYNEVENYPIIVGDRSLYPAQEDSSFKYFFHLSLVNKIKEQDPDAMNALSLLSQQ